MKTALSFAALALAAVMFAGPANAFKLDGLHQQSPVETVAQTMKKKKAVKKPVKKKKFVKKGKKKVMKKPAKKKVASKRFKKKPKAAKP